MVYCAGIFIFVYETMIGADEILKDECNILTFCFIIVTEVALLYTFIVQMMSVQQ